MIDGVIRTEALTPALVLVGWRQLTGRRRRFAASRQGYTVSMNEDSGDSGERHSDAAPVTITPYPDGPYLVRGDFVLRDREGNEMALGRRTIALCRCGKSRMRPLCDGTHRLSGFQAPSGQESWPDGGDVEGR